MGYGTSSKKVLGTLHPDLKKIMNLAIERSHVDFGLHQGARTVEKQQEYYNNGKSRINPSAYSNKEQLAQKAKHITIEGHAKYALSRAVDLHVSESFNSKKLTWDDIHLGYIAGVIISCAKELLEKGEISHEMRWGGDWDRDGVIALDHKLKDFPHFELLGV